MSNVEFKEEYRKTYTTTPKGLEGMAIRLGLAKTKKGAQIALLITAGVAVVIAFVAPRILGGGGNTPPPQAEVDAALELPL